MKSRRIDNQLRGRSGRQGDPGRSKFFLSLQDDLMRIFGSERMDGMLQKLGLKEDEAIIHPWINKALEKAQKKVEARNFDIRKNLLKFDDVQNDQRKVMAMRTPAWCSARRSADRDRDRLTPQERRAEQRRQRVDGAGGLDVRTVRGCGRTRGRTPRTSRVAPAARLTRACRGSPRPRTIAVHHHAAAASASARSP